MNQPPRYAFIKKTALALPEAREIEDRHGWWFNIGTKSFVTYWAADARWIFKLPKAQQMMLFDTRPETFMPMRAGALLWSYVKVEDLEPAELRDLIVAAWRTIATKKLQRAFDGVDTTPPPRMVRDD